MSTKAVSTVVRTALRSVGRAGKGVVRASRSTGTDRETVGLLRNVLDCAFCAVCIHAKHEKFH